MDSALALLTAALGGYALGATPFGFLIAKLKGVDIRTVGSKNIGATNVWRQLGAAYGLPVFILDALKGWFPAWAAMSWFPGQGSSELIASLGGILAGMGAVLGHNFTFWLKGRGGKGVATSAGALIGLAPLAVGAATVVWALLFFIVRYSSLASIGAAVTVPTAMAVMMQRSGNWNGLLLGFGTLLCVLTIWRHKANIGRLMAGTELKVGQKKKEEGAS
jgi:glycerol-3-phosphate acyltransferase PlsY